jgi:RNA polymerase sigma-70 factor, ECF subfamily
VIAMPEATRAAPTGPTDGFDAFYAAHHTRVVVAMYAYLGDMAQAQDIAQEAFARALARWNRIAAYDDPLAWVLRVAWNLATSRWRQLRRFDLFAAQQRTEHVPAPSADRIALGEALATLPMKLRRAIVMHYLADMSLGEIAEREGVPVGTVKSWLHRGRTALAAALAGPGEGDGHA